MPERIGVALSEVLKDPKHRDNLIMFGGDSVNIPEFDPVVMVQGAVNSPGAVAFDAGKEPGLVRESPPEATPSGRTRATRT